MLTHMAEGELPDGDDACDARFGPLGKKCARCSQSRHACVEVRDMGLRSLWGSVVAARDAHDLAEGDDSGNEGEGGE